ncbi:SGNH/GDSL hydrolase family protein [Bacillus sp. KH172YL63]|uniref:SGNH/GDSL hydrolase family protein n=1 Tax=Bacillus sp. KH172YL63 TaxID=2709784 RepID=UPI0013E44374|nr:SGNH/GDSL hydrolase family protein [Bacillus sp. KH172YL63]BCB05877.1 hydrolase [Bacillus sp. KH172YL63]
MKKAFILLLFIIAAGVIVYGNLHWNSMTATSGEKEGQETAPAVTSETKESAANEDDYISFMENWPEGAQEVYEEKAKADEPFHIVLMGSQAMDAAEKGWDDLVMEKLQDVYGDTITVQSVSFDMNTLEFVNETKYGEIADFSPNLVIFEPLTLNDNGEVVIEDSLINIETIMDGIQGDADDTFFALTPPQPVYSPNLYAFQIEQTREFAEDHEIPYIDHWENWPSVDDEEIKNYLNADSSPNAEGQQAWAQGVIDYLISE